VRRIVVFLVVVPDGARAYRANASCSVSPMARHPQLLVRGATGSTPTSGPSRLRYGGHTTCYTLDAIPDEPIVIDAGTGLAFSADLVTQRPTHFHMLLTHFHLDHLLGLQTFRPFFSSEHRFTFYAFVPRREHLRDAIAGVFAEPWFPVRLDDVPSRLEFVVLDGTPFSLGPVLVNLARLHHPQGVTAFRLTHGRRSVVIATDHEAGRPEVDTRLIEFAIGADVLIHDAQFTPEEAESLYHGWGHSTWKDAVRIAADADVGRLVLTSHDPFRTDDEIDEIVALARQELRNVEAAYEGLAIPM
jgi:phosphoribosyl 1,2-cyclic phosphodiesterase